MPIPFRLTTLAATLISALAFAPAAPAAEPAPAADARPTLFTIGDSTVKNSSGKGDGGLWGWGDFIGDSFDKAKINVVNRALGGRSSRTFQTEGLWDKVLAEMKPGDFVLLQFGHNDGGPMDTGRARASIKGNGDETKEVTLEATKKQELVHSYGWYIRKYVADAKAKGATPVVCSPIPRNRWTNGKVDRATADYAKWAGEAAKAGGAGFIDLNAIVAGHYDAEGQPKVETTYFGKADSTHTIKAGAQLNAKCVVEGLKKLPDCPLGKYLAKPGS